MLVTRTFMGVLRLLHAWIYVCAKTLFFLHREGSESAATATAFGRTNAHKFVHVYARTCHARFFLTCTCCHTRVKFYVCAQIGRRLDGSPYGARWFPWSVAGGGERDPPRDISPI